MDLVLEKQFLFPFLLPPSFYIYYFMMTLTSSRHGRWGISYIHYTLVYQETLTRRLIDSIKNGGRRRSMYIVLIKPTDITLHVQPIPLHLLHLVWMGSLKLNARMIKVEVSKYLLNWMLGFTYIFEITGQRIILLDWNQN